MHHHQSIDRIKSIKEQLVPGLPNEEAQIELIKRYEYVFAENGLTGYRNGQSISRESLLGRFGEEQCQELINFCLEYMSRISLPVKRGNFIEFRRGMINVSPIGRSCSHQERLQFAEYDRKYQVRDKFVQALREKFPESVGLKFAIGGQISIDIFPIGWDKTYCLRFLKQFDQIHFFGDKTEVGGNDHELYSHSSVVGHKVNGPEDTIEQLSKLFNL
jgi:phosphomannomutase